MIIVHKLGEKLKYITKVQWINDFMNKKRFKSAVYSFYIKGLFLTKIQN